MHNEIIHCELLTVEMSCTKYQVNFYLIMNSLYVISIQQQQA
jgi:hypothetical protein